MLRQDKCGDAIKCLEESQKSMIEAVQRLSRNDHVFFLNIETDYDSAVKKAHEYSQAKGPGTTCKPEQHLFFRKLQPIIQRMKEKCERENGFM